MQTHLTQLTKLVRYFILTSTTEAGSGHPTSSMSATELLVALMFGEGGLFRQDLNNPRAFTNDRLIFSKGHAAPLLYSLYTAAGALPVEELMTLRKFGSKIEGHPTPEYPFADIASGSLGQGLSVGLGMALGIKLRIARGELKTEGREPRVYVLLGDSEVAEGQVYEAAQAASFYNATNLVAVLDVNRLGQRGATMVEWDLDAYQKRFQSFGWNAVTIPDGHDIELVLKTYQESLQAPEKPTIFIAKTVKGKGVSFLENKDNWHGKSVPQEMLADALKELGSVDTTLKGEVAQPAGAFTPTPAPATSTATVVTYKDKVATREVYGDSLVELGRIDPSLVAIDAETGNSTYLEKFQKVFPDRYFELYIAEQNMVSVAVGFRKLGFNPYVATFSAFLTRAFDQIRMAQYSEADLNICGSHAGVSIGQDGASQMGLEDIAMMRSILHSTVLYPSDPYQTHALMTAANNTKGITYIRTTREKTNVLYSPSDTFFPGGAKILAESPTDVAVVIAAGITLHESLKAQELLKNEQKSICIVDVYSIKPLDEETITQLIMKYKNVIVAEDHYPYGGLGDAISSVIAHKNLPISQFVHLCVRAIPHSGSPEELLRFEKIDAEAIAEAVRRIPAR